MRWLVHILQSIGPDLRDIRIASFGWSVEARIVGYATSSMVLILAFRRRIVSAILPNIGFACGASIAGLVCGLRIVAICVTIAVIDLVIGAAVEGLHLAVTAIAGVDTKDDSSQR